MAQERVHNNQRMNEFDSNNYVKLISGAIFNFIKYQETPLPQIKGRLTSAAASLESLFAETFSNTTHVGVFHSSGDGAFIPPMDLGEHQDQMAIYGISRMTLEEAEVSAATIHHLVELRQAAESIRVTNQRGALNDFLRRAYVPVPEAIQGPNFKRAPVVGPLPLANNMALQILNWVRGPVLHSQLEAEPTAGQGAMSKTLRDAQISIVGQMTGIFQAVPPNIPGYEMPRGIVNNLKAYYINQIVSSVQSFLNFGDATMGAIQDRVLGSLETLVSCIEVDPHLMHGNVAVGFDSALRNWVTNLGDTRGNEEGVLNRVYNDGAVNFEKLWPMMTRIDCGRSKGGYWRLVEEDGAHVTRNVSLLGHSSNQVQQWLAQMTLSRLVMRNYYNDRITTAADMANELLELQNQELKCNDSVTYQQFKEQHPISAEVIPTIRLARQGSLSLGTYATKAFWSAEKLGLDSAHEEYTSRINESLTYLQAFIEEMAKLAPRAGFSKLTTEYDDMLILQNELREVHSFILDKGPNRSKMLAAGESLLGMYSK